MTVWIWVIGGVIAGLLLFTVFIELLTLTAQSQQRELAKASFAEIVTSINSLCDSRIGSAIQKTVKFPDSIKIVYAVDNEKNKPPENSIGNGSFVCYNTEKEKNCEKLNCNIEFFSLKSNQTLLSIVDKLLGRFGVDEYNILVKKNECGITVLPPNVKDSCVPQNVTSG